MPTLKNDTYSFSMPDKIPFRKTAAYWMERERLAKEFSAPVWSLYTIAAAAQTVGLITDANFGALSPDDDTELIAFVGGNAMDYIHGKLEVPKV